MQCRGQLDRVVATQRVTHDELGTMASIDARSSIACEREKSSVSRAKTASRCASVVRKLVNDASQRASATSEEFWKA